MPAAKKATRKRTKTAKRTKLTKKQLAQRKYAGSMGGLRKRARKASGGTGRIKKRPAAKTLRRKLGLNA